MYAGRAKGRDGLRGRLSVHLSTGPDLSRSTFRSWVAVSVLDVPRPVTRQRPTVMTEEQVAQVNAWITSCYVGWVEKPTVAATIAFEEALLREWKPRLNHD
ncbi:GIY-YIG nuclease family protein [Curtobacterium sp. MCBD17_040]|uniref:GIY-YIG nuclease family protein n=1 Tax=Curtobacterium sp. MCBD17_040 TaxID=2175674 RepID=UPI0032E850EF